MAKKRIDIKNFKLDPVTKKDGQFLLMNKSAFYDWLQDNEFERRIDLIQNHHTWKPNYSNFNGDDHFDDLKAMDSYHENHNNWSDIAQNITIFPDGMIGICRPFDKAPAGIKGANSHGLCIESYGNFDKGGDEMTLDQRGTIRFVNAALCDRFNLKPSTKTIVYHHWWDLKTGKRRDGKGSTKSCPGTNFFGGNKVEDCKANLIPQVKSALGALEKMREL